MGPSLKAADPRHTVSESRRIVADQRLPKVLVGPRYLTTAQARDPSTWEPVHWKVFIGSRNKGIERGKLTAGNLQDASVSAGARLSTIQETALIFSGKGTNE